MRTLYVSDLDGTLLNEHAKLSSKTIEIINNLVSQGMLFTIATGRSFDSSKEVTSGLDLRLPLILANGSYLVEPKTCKIIKASSFLEYERDFIIETLSENGCHALVYTCVDGVEQKYYNVVSKEEIADLDVSKIIVKFENESIGPLQKMFIDAGFSCYFYKSMYYEKQYWLEIYPENTDKATAVKKLKEMAGADKVVCFGDGFNDIEMFKFCDESYATENSVQELKNIATGVIEKHTEDAVAKWLLERVNL
ncbi:MAG: HAD family hydrolase [Defluviitaleaceae bacterium]|nr:HAD family hydrolase [Defluviitaleaceae bacterium]